MTYESYKTYKYSLQALALVRNKTHNTYHITDNRQKAVMKVRARIAGFAVDLEGVNVGKFLEAKLNIVLFKESLIEAGLIISRFSRNRYRYYLRKTKKVYIPAGIVFGKSVLKVVALLAVVFGYVMMFVGKTLVEFALASFMFLSLRARSAWRSALEQLIRLFRRSKVEALKLLAKTYALSIRLRVELVRQERLLANRLRERSKIAWRSVQKNVIRMYKHLKYMLTVLYVIVEERVSKTAVFTSTKAGALKLLAMTGKESTLIIAKETKELVVLEGMNLFIGLVSFMENVREQGVDTALTVKEISSEQSIKFYANLISLVQILHLYSRIAINRLLLRLWRIAKMRVLSIRLLASLASGLRRSKIEAFKLLAKTVISLRLLRPQGRTGSLRQQLVAELAYLAGRRVEAFDYALLLAKTGRLIEKNTKSTYIHLKYLLTVLYVIIEKMVSKTAVFTSTKAGAAYTYMRPKLARFSKSVFARLEVGAELLVQFALLFIDYSQKLLSFLIRLGRIGLAWTANYLAPVVDVVEIMVFEPAWEFIQKRSVFIRKAVAITSLSFLIVGSISPVLAVEIIPQSIVEFTDASIDPLNPVLQQEASVSGNEGSNLVADVRKKVEELTRPDNSEEGVELSDDGDSGSFQPSSANDNIMPEQLNEADSEAAEDNTAEEQTQNLDPCVVSNSMELDSEAPPGEATGSGEAIEENGSEDGSSEETDQPAGNDQINQDQAIESGEADEEENDLVSESAGDEGSDQGAVEGVEDDPGSEEAQAGSAGNEGSDDQGIEDVDPDIHQDCGVMGQDDAGAQDINTGDSSLLDTQEIKKNIVEIVNTNNIKVTNEVDSDSLTGKNIVSAGDSGRDVFLGSGAINIHANVLNVVNTNLYNSKIVEIAESFNNLTADVLLNHPETRPAELTQDLVNYVCSSTLTCDSLSSFNLTNKNNAEVENNVDVFGNSGQNLLENIKERGTIRSGNVNALVNILNIVNSNLVNSRWTIASINVFGDWEGDLVLPSELYFTDFFQLGATDNSDIKVEDIKKVLININNDNDVEVQNNVIVDSDSGKNSIEATKSAGGKGGGLTDDEMGTGESRGESNVKNYLNTNVLNGKWYLGMVNTLGAWSGDVYSLPDRVALGTTPTGLSFFSSNSKDSDLAYQMFEETMAEINKEDTTLIDIQNQNKAKIVNNVDLGVLSGENGIKGNEMNVKESGIFSGNTYALANILNFANTNLVNADLNIGLVNVFGRWNGNVLFGFPDLTVSQTTRQEFPKEKDKTVIYDVSYSNMGSSSMMGGSLEWHYDNELLRLDSVDPVVNYEEKSPGAVEFDLGRVSPNARGKFAIKLTTLKNLEVNSEIESYAHIFGIGPERVKENNESVYTAIAVTTASSSGPAPPPSNNPPPSQDPPGTQNPPDTQEPPNDDDEDAAGEPEPDETQNDDPVEGDPNDTNENPNDPNNNEPQENQPQNNPSNNNQGQQQQQNQRTSTGLIRVYKTNNALSSGVKPGEPVEFTLTVDNDGIDDVFNVVLYDTLRGPDGVALTTRKFPLGRMEAGEEVVLVYEIDANPFAPAGTYTNTAYVEALNFQLQAITSQFSAISSFKLVNPNPKPLPDDEVVELIKDNDQGEEQQEKLNEEEEDTAQGQEGETDEAIEQDENEKVGLNSNQNKNTPINTNTVKGTRFSRTNPQANFAGGGALGELTPAAKAELIDIIPLLENSSHDGVQSDSTRQMIMFIIIASLMGFGYATANLVNRLKKAKVQKLTNNNMPGKDKILFLVFAMILGNSGMGAIMDINLNIPVAQAAAQSCTTPTVISFPFAVQGNAGGVDLNANAKVTGNVYSNANINGQYWAKVIGNASAIGTITQTQVTGVTTTGAAAAGMPTVNVADWKASALLGGTIGGVSFPVNSSGNNLGPVKINGDLILNDNSDVQVNGTVHVTGNVIIGKNAELHVNPALGALGTVVIVDGKIDIDGNGHVDGTGGGGFMLLISLSSGSDAINLQPNFASSTAVFYSMNDGLMVGSNSEIVGAYGEKVVVDDNAKVNHVPGLQVATFVCPPPALVPDISVTKSADSSSVTAGDTVTFTIEVENSGTASATGVLVSDVLDSEFEFVSSTPSPTTTLITGLGTELTYSLGTVGIGQTKIITIEAKTDAGVVSTTLVENKATASGSNFSDENSNTVEVTINPSVAPAIVVTKSSDESLVSVGDSVVFTLEVENTGTADATNVVLSDTLALEFEFVSSTPVPTTNTVTALGTELTFD
ncbi:MAG: hypothetical protein Q8P83_00005, partial [bacterium]|nr:hypothetical protein [bacterium]